MTNNILKVFENNTIITDLDIELIKESAYTSLDKDLKERIESFPDQKIQLRLIKNQLRARKNKHLKETLKICINACNTNFKFKTYITEKHSSLLIITHDILKKDIDITVSPEGINILISSDNIFFMKNLKVSTEYDVDKIYAEFKKNILRITLPYKKKIKKKIKIHAD